ncbi:MAG: Nif3-like dinuclear metal center hexameric protein [Candidatus Heimdallarchaeota archaeon]|nr:Nif3-like dinuclear metal center hexameric protein [Candidatus Heimdallarchaeota archaeon]
MNALIKTLEKIREKSIQDKFCSSGIVISNDRIGNSKSNLKCLISSRVTRKVVAQAAQEKVDLIISIYPPLLIQNNNQKIIDEHLELLEIIIENKIAIYSFGEKWLFTENSGVDYIFELLEFPYKKPFECVYLNKKGEEKILLGRIAERKSRILFDDFLKLFQHLLEKENIRYLGYNKQPLQKIVMLNEITNETEIFEIKSNQKIDAIVVGDISYEALLAAQLMKLSIAIIGKRNLENLVLNHIRRKIMEEITIELPEIIVLKQDEIGSIFTNE